LLIFFLKKNAVREFLVAGDLVDAICSCSAPNVKGTVEGVVGVADSDAFLESSACIQAPDLGKSSKECLRFRAPITFFFDITVFLYQNKIPVHQIDPRQTILCFPEC
jgi:phage tail protein X